MLKGKLEIPRKRKRSEGVSENNPCLAVEEIKPALGFFPCTSWGMLPSRREESKISLSLKPTQGSRDK